MGGLFDHLNALFEEGHRRDIPDLLTDAQFARGRATPAAVLIAVTDRPEPGVILTQRPRDMRDHPGQVAFPGGKIDPGESPEGAALREAEEEVGLDSSQVDVIGTFGPYYSGSGYCISPVVGMVRGEPQLTINEDEVAAAFEVPLSFLMNQKNHNRASRFFKETEVYYYEMPYPDSDVDPPVERRIWGATAGIIRMVQERLYGVAD